MQNVGYHLQYLPQKCLSLISWTTGSSSMQTQVQSQSRRTLGRIDHCHQWLCTIQNSFLQQLWEAWQLFLFSQCLPINFAGQEQLYRTFVGSHISVHVPPFWQGLFLQQPFTHVTSPSHEVAWCFQKLIKQFFFNFSFIQNNWSEQRKNVFEKAPLALYTVFFKIQTLNSMALIP